MQQYLHPQLKIQGYALLLLTVFSSIVLHNFLSSPTPSSTFPTMLLVDALPTAMTNAILFSEPYASRSLWHFQPSTNSSFTSQFAPHYSTFTPIGQSPPPPAQQYGSGFGVATFNGIDDYVDLNKPYVDGGTKAAGYSGPAQGGKNVSSEWSFSVWVYLDALPSQNMILLSRSDSHLFGVNRTLLVYITPNGIPMLSYFDGQQHNNQSGYPGWTGPGLVKTPMLRTWVELGLMFYASLFQGAFRLTYDFYYNGYPVGSVVNKIFGALADGPFTRQYLGRSDLTVYTKDMIPFRGSMYAFLWIDFWIGSYYMPNFGSPLDPGYTTTPFQQPFLFTKLATLTAGQPQANPITDVLSPWKDYSYNTISSGQSIPFNIQPGDKLTQESIWSNDFSLSWYFRLASLTFSQGAAVWTMKDVNQQYYVTMNMYLSGLTISYGRNDTGVPVVAIDKLTIITTQNGKWMSLDGSKQYDQTQWHLITLSAVLTGLSEMNLTTFIDTSIATQNFNITRLQGTRYANIYLGPDTATLDTEVFGVWYVRNTIFNAADIEQFMIPVQTTYVHDAPKSAAAGSTVVVTFTSTLKTVNSSLIVSGGYGALLTYQPLDFNTMTGIFSFRVAFVIPSARTTSTYTISFGTPSSSPLQVLPPPICIEVFDPSSVIDSSLTVLTPRQLLDTADWTIPFTAPFTGVGDFSLLPGLSGLGQYLSCPGNCPTGLSLLNFATTKVVPWPGISGANPTEWTFSIWFQMNGDSGQLFSAYNTQASDGYLSIAYDSYLPDFNYVQAGTGLVCSGKATNAGRSGKWSHLVVQSGKGGCSIYHDGILSSVDLQPYTSSWNMSYNPSIPFTFTQARLGGVSVDGIIGLEAQGFNGSFASIHFWNRWLSPREVTFLQANKPVALQIPSTKSERIAVLDLPSASSLLSSSAFVHTFDRAPTPGHGTLIPAPSGAIGYHVISFDGTQNPLNLLLPSDVANSTQTNRVYPKDGIASTNMSASWSIWFQYTRYNDQLTDAYLVYISDQAQTNSIEINPTWFRLISNSQAACFAKVQAGQAAIPACPSCFTHLVAMFDYQQKQCSLALNGQIVAVGTLQIDPVPAWTVATAQMGSPGTGSSLVGMLAEFAYYRRALTVGEIVTLARNPPPSVSLPTTANKLTAAQTILANADYDFTPVRQYYPGVPSYLADLNQPNDLGVGWYTGAGKTDLTNVTAAQTGLSYSFPQFLTSKTLTLAFWLNIPSNRTGAPNGNGPCLFGASSSLGSIKDAIQLVHIVDTHDLEWLIIDETGTNYTCHLLGFSPVNSVTLPLDTWIHIATTFDSRQYCNMYLNGGQVATAPAKTSLDPLPASLQPRMVSRPIVTLGGCDGNPNFFGSIAQFTFWQRALDPTEIAVLYTQPPPSIARIVYPSSSLTLLDASTPPQPTIEWLFTNAGTNYSLQGANGAKLTVGQYVDLMSPNSSLPGKQIMPLLWGGDSFSFTMWVDLFNSASTLTSSVNGARLFECSSDSTVDAVNGENIIAFGVKSDWSFYFEMSVPLLNSATPVVTRITTPPAMFLPLLETWQHIGLVYDATTQLVYITQNGAIVATGVWNTVFNPAALRTIRQKCLIGTSRNAVAYQRIDMYVQYFAFHNNIALSPAQLYSLYHYRRVPVNTLTHPDVYAIDTLRDSSLLTFNFAAQPISSLRTPPLSGSALAFAGTSNSGLGHFIQLNSPLDTTWESDRTLAVSSLSNIRYSGLTILFWLHIKQAQPANTHVMEWYAGSDLSTRFVLKISNMQWHVHMFRHEVLTCDVLLDGYTISPSPAYHTLYGFTFSPDGSIAYYEDSNLHPNSVSPSSCAIYDSTAAGFAPFPDFGVNAISNITFGGGYLVDGTTTFGLTGDLTMIHIFTRVVTQSEQQLIYDSPLPGVIAPTSSVTRVSNSLDSSNYRWKFLTPPNQPQYKERNIQLEKAPSGVGSIGHLNGSSGQYMDLSSSYEESYKRALYMPGGGNYAHGVSLWLKFGAFQGTSGTINANNSMIFDLSPQAPNQNVSRIQLTLLSEDINQMKGYRLSLFTSDGVGKAQYTLETQSNVVRPNEWTHILFAMTGLPDLPFRAVIVSHEGYVNGALCAVQVGSLPPGPADRVGSFGYDTMKSRPSLDVQVADIVAWQLPIGNYYDMRWTTDTVLDVYRTAPPQIAGTLGSEFDRLLASAAARYDCAPRTPDVKSTSLVTFAPGVVAGTGYCLFNNDTDQYSSYLDLSNPWDNPSGPLVPLSFTTDPAITSVLTSSGITISMHIVLSSYPPLNIFLWSCGSAVGTPNDRLLLHLQRNGADFFLYFVIDGIQIVGTQISESQLPRFEPVHIVYVVSTTTGSGSVFTPYINGRKYPGGIAASPIPMIQRQCFFGRNIGIAIGPKPVTQSNFQGKLALFAFWTRALSEKEIKQLATWTPPSISVSSMLSTTSVVDTPTRFTGYNQTLQVQSNYALTCYNRPIKKAQVMFDTGANVDLMCSDPKFVQVDESTAVQCLTPVELIEGPQVSTQLYISTPSDDTTSNVLLFGAPTTANFAPTISFIASMTVRTWGPAAFTPVPAIIPVINPYVLSYTITLQQTFTNVRFDYTVPPGQNLTVGTPKGAINIPYGSVAFDTQLVNQAGGASNVFTFSLAPQGGSLYTFTIINPAPQVKSIAVAGIWPSTSPGSSITLDQPFSSQLTSYLLKPISEITQTVTFSISLNAGANITYWTSYVATNYSLTYPNTTFTIPIRTGGNTTLYIRSTYSMYQVIVQASVPQSFIKSLTVKTYGSQQPLSDVQSLAPPLANANHAYTFTTTTPYPSVQLNFAIIPGDTVTISGGTMVGSQVLRYPTNQVIVPVLGGQDNTITLQSAWTGTYTFTYTNPPYPLQSLTVGSMTFSTVPSIPEPSLVLTPLFSPDVYSYSLLTFNTATQVQLRTFTTIRLPVVLNNSATVLTTGVNISSASIDIAVGTNTFTIQAPDGNYTLIIYATAPSDIPIPFTSLQIIETVSRLPLNFTTSLSVSTVFSYLANARFYDSLIAYSLLVTCVDPCVAFTSVNGGARTKLEVDANEIPLHVLNAGLATIQLNSPASSLYPNYTLLLQVPPAQPCLLQTCANGGTCINQVSLTYSTSYTCYCTASYEGAHCETLVTTPYQPTYPTAIIYSSSSIMTDCLNLTLDGSDSYGLGPAGLHPYFAWSLTSIKMGGYEIMNSADPTYNSTLATFTFASVNLSTTLTGSSASFPSVVSSIQVVVGTSLINSATYTFSLRVGNDREISSAVYVSVTKVADSSRPAWTPAVGIRVPNQVKRSDVVVITSALTLSSCDTMPIDVVTTYQWNVTMTSKLVGASSLLPDVSTVPALSHSISSNTPNTLVIPSNFFRTGYSYIVTLDLTLFISGSNSQPVRRLLIVESVDITAFTTIVPTSSPVTARIIGSDRIKPIDAPFIIAADLSFDPDYVNDDVAQPVNAPFYSGLAFTWSCKEVVGGTPCTQLSTGVDLTQVRVNVPSGMMSIGVTYQWTVLVTSIIDSSRSATATVRVTGSQPSLQSSSKPPLVTILNAPIRMNSDQTLRLSASVVTQTSTSVIDMLYLWSLTCTTNSLTPPPIINNVTTTTTQLLPSLQQQSNLGSAVNSSSLVLQPNLLLVPGEYEFSVTVTDPYTTVISSSLTGTGTGSAALATAVTSVTIIVNARPQPGDCSIVPASGIALETVFTLTCSNWYEPLNANFAPFTYSIAYRADNDNENDNENENKNKNTNTNTNTGDPTTYQQLTSSSLLTQRSFLLPSGSISLRIVITDQIGASSEFDLLPPITVQVSPHALFDLMAYIANLTYIQLPHVMAAGGDSLASISFIHQIADLVNSARTQSPYQDDAMSQSKLLQFNIDLLESYQQALVTTLELVQSSLDTTTLSIMTQSLIPLTQYAYQLPTNVVSNVTLEVVKSLLDVGIISTHIDEPGSPVKDLTLVLSNLMTTCSQLDVISTLVHESMRLRQIHAVAGESIELAALNYYAYVERTLVAAGTEIHLPTGESVILTPTAMKNYILKLNQLNITTIDTGGAVGAAEMDTRIVTFSSRWSTCRTQSQQSTMPSISSLTNIEITFPNGDLVDIPSLDTDIVFTIPISKNSTDSILNLAREQLPCPAAPFDEMVVANTSFTCQFWNVTTRSYSSSGCHSLGVTFLPDGSTSLKCSCSHLTEFAILYAEAQNLYNTDVCADIAESNLGSSVYLIFLIIYSVVGLIAFIQLVRVLTLHGMKKFVFISLEHALILAMCVFRAVNQSMYYTLYKEISISKQIIISSLPYLFYSWIFTLVIVTWASIWATSARGEKNDNPLKPYKLQFFIGNIAITCAFLVIFGLMSQTTDLDSLRTLNRVGVALTCIVEMGFGLFLVVYGLLLVRALTEHFVSAYAKKLGGIAIAFSIAFGVSAAILAYSVAEEDAFARHSVAYNSVYFALDVVGLLLVMYLFAKSISKASGDRGSKSDGGSTNGRGSSNRSHNPLSSKSGGHHSRNASSKQLSIGNGGSKSENLQMASVASPVSRAIASSNAPMSPSASSRPAPPSRKQHQPPSFLKKNGTLTGSLPASSSVANPPVAASAPRPGSPPPLPPAAYPSNPSSPSMHPLDDTDAAAVRPSSTIDTIPSLEDQQRTSTVASVDVHVESPRDSSTIDME